MGKRSYELGSRADAMWATRERILDVAVDLLVPGWLDEFTIADVARASGVSSQTVVNHFGSKEQLYLAGIAERVAPVIEITRAKAVPGDLESIVEVACEDYEVSGDAMLLLIPAATRSKELALVVKQGRVARHAWVERCFAPWLDGLSAAARRRRVITFAAILDVSTWHTLRRVEGLSIAETRRTLRDILEPFLRR